MNKKEFNEIKSHITRYIIEQYNFDYKERVTPDEIIDLIKPFVKPAQRFEVGDKVNVYHGNDRTPMKGKITKTYGIMLLIEMEDIFEKTELWFHQKQCRKLSKKNAKTPEK